MIGIIIGAVILIVLLNLMLGDEIQILPAIGIAFCTLVGWNILQFLLIHYFQLPPIAALFIVGAVVTVGLGATLSLILGAPFKSACLVAVTFFGSYIAVSICMGLVFRLLLSPVAT